MVCEQVLKDLFSAFPNAFINHNLEFVAEPNKRVNSYFCLIGCHSRMEVSAKVLEWLSRESCYSLHYSTDRKNDMVHEYHRNGINRFLGTDFTREDLKLIYEKLGNAINHNLTLEFINSGYDMEILRCAEGRTGWMNTSEEKML